VAGLNSTNLCSAAGGDESRIEVSNDRLTMRNVTLNDTASILCGAYNRYGHVLSSVYLNVYGTFPLRNYSMKPVAVTLL